MTTSEDCDGMGVRTPLHLMSRGPRGGSRGREGRYRECSMIEWCRVSARGARAVGHTNTWSCGSLRLQHQHGSINSAVTH
eukprot:1621038-Prymnesium_polylepis.1